jgi:DNA-binding response OmpR family regulator
VLIVSPDEHWLRALDVTVRAWGHRTITRRTVADALRMRAGDAPPRAIVFDLGAEWSAQDLETVRALLAETPIPAIVILPERLASERERIAAAGATVLTRPYRPSELQAALPPAEPVPEGGAEPAGGEPG